MLIRFSSRRRNDRGFRPLNYRHIFHAGNVCDVVKHAVLALLIERLREKEKPFCLIDTHAGIGLYDLQDARARWPFVAMWDNHEYSWLGWQGLQVFDGKTRPPQSRKVAANQAPLGSRDAAG